ncbi:thioredoxin family protein [Microbacterium sp. APC 3898]|uniref:Thioredoxin family protein n=2 Tax=Planococcus TaxID=1372 RepID=A0ABT7ZHW5_9BACL|nr:MULTISPECIES: thioredoxin family protein [Terrabacteria group]MBF6633950.1 thioredoxin family protein [Planococcus sp. (in: firmicutes)]MBD8015633.1 thioredoxin family protein [Planococcus wigleyi]MDN3426751.1 thioredoxin family protein [Planococcus sp. APC 4016]MDN3438006.1 thioredoxin family protein [Planococcus sp. APC 3900]MDN3500261.1 thioredoxin family protein [Microbacterium sp. APC 3898]
MEIISAIEEYQSKIAQEQSFLLFVKTENCSVCEGLRPQVEAFESDYGLPFYLVNAAKVPELAGQLMLFTAPVILLFRQGKEIQRWARFVPIDELRHRLDELEESLNV